MYSVGSIVIRQPQFIVAARNTREHVSPLFPLFTYNTFRPFEVDSPHRTLHPAAISPTSGSETSPSQPPPRKRG